MEKRAMILGTDWWDDCDDAAALRLLARSHHRGDIRLLGVNIDACSPLSAPALDAFLAGEGLPGLPLGIDLEATDFGGHLTYQQRLAGLPGDHRQNEDCEAGVRLYRRLLAGEPGPVDIVEIGFPQVLAQLLRSEGDAFSPLSGEELVRAKVGKLWMMAGKWDEEGGRENNFARNARASRGAAEVCRNWPTAITFLGFEVGCTVVTGSALSPGDPLGKIFRDHGSEHGRLSWDPMLAYMACLGDEEKAGYRLVRGWARVDAETGCNFFTPDDHGRHGYVVKTLPDEAYARAIDDILLASNP